MKRKDQKNHSKEIYLSNQVKDLKKINEVKEKNFKIKFNNKKTN